MATPTVEFVDRSAPVANIVTCILAVFLCLVNAVVWAFISEMPLMGIAWVGAAFACVLMQKWARG